MNERDRADWVKVAERLGFVAEDERRFTHKHEINRYYAVDYENDVAMLHGLACLRANGAVTASGHPDIWFYSCKAEGGSMDTHPAAILAMLTAHEEAKP